MLTLLTALLLGLAGSLHCVAMCGPLLLALPLDAAGRWQVVRQMLVYHSGRILTYAALGVAFGLLGQGIAVAGLQKLLALAAGGTVLLLALAAWQFERLVTALPGFDGLRRWVQARIGALMRSHRSGSTFALGLLNGLLPCGMVYAALAGAIATAQGAEGGLFMVVFGAGTLPLLLAVSVLGRSLRPAVRLRLRRAQPVLLVVVALLLLQRGLHLDLSLFDSAVPAAPLECH
jgi:sulfite exporter TauE/SafE